MPLNPADITLRSQNIGLGESQADRAQRMRLAQMQDAIARAQMAQQATQFGLSQAQQESQFARQMGANEYQFNENRDQQDRNAIGQGIAGALGGAGSIIGAGLAPGGFFGVGSMNGFNNPYRGWLNGSRTSSGLAADNDYINRGPR